MIIIIFAILFKTKLICDKNKKILISIIFLNLKVIKILLIFCSIIEKIHKKRGKIKIIYQQKITSYLFKFLLVILES